MTTPRSQLANESSEKSGAIYLFGAAVFSGAFLIFLVQPMVAKLILPWFGGGPGIWTTCLMFYQTTLFLGYLYAYGIVRFLAPRVQAITHGALLLTAFALLPVLPGSHWKPVGSESNPSLSILVMLLANVGLPFAALAATGPLVQAWFARQHPLRSPYSLYSVSNFGSLSALLCFPLLLEPLLPLREASRLWTIGFGLGSLLILGCAFSAIRSAQSVTAPPAPLSEAESAPTSAGDRALWLLLPATAVVLLMAITNKLCQDLASFPFLWIIPLGLYLGSFILSFASEASYKRSLWIRIALTALLVKYGLVFAFPSGSIQSAIFWSMFVQVPLLGLVLFSLCMLLHGELYRLRPPARSLTSFYIGLSGGGALGGVFVGLVAPWIFNDYFELHTGYALTFALLFFTFRRDDDSWISSRAPKWRAASVALSFSLILTIAVAATLEEAPGLLLKERNFFGLHRVIEWETQKPEWARRILKHGSTVHGAQLLAERFQRRPISYYGAPTGIGLTMKRDAHAEPVKTGVVGMGAGSLAAYGRRGDTIRFYEIDPSVIRIASQGQYFSFLPDSLAKIDIIPGDARLSLEAELRSGASQQFDLLVIDAFSSDAIPFHLITLEAFQLYLEHLAPEGLIAIHVSNRHFRLSPILYRIGDELGLSSISVDSPGLGLRVSTSAQWVLMSRDRGKLDAHAHLITDRMAGLGLDPTRLSVGRLEEAAFAKKPLWTDEFNSVLDILGSAK
ncbi:MAG: fused MFS/spermidine synthase [Myxococcota bacterium]|nr:fused MFS/spermidine synthase [Myxococcota bacterium]